MCLASPFASREAGAKSFTLRYVINGQQRVATIGSWPSWSVVDAREKAKELRRAVESGTDPLEQKHERQEAPTFAHLVDQYITRHLAKTKSGT